MSNVENHLDAEIHRVQMAVEDFREVRWFLVESDSSDQTVSKLEALARKFPDFYFRSEGALQESLPARTERLAHCRNVYLQALENRSELRGSDYVLVVDLDGMNTLLSVHGVRSCWDRDDWDACFANQLGPYYDIWALRHPSWCPNDCFVQHRFYRSLGMSRKASYARAVESRMITIPPDSEWIPVNSAFGGLGIYRAAVLMGKRYRGKGQDDEPLCEHVALHSELIADGANLVINPRLINSDTTEHSSNVKPDKKARQSLARRAERLLVSVARRPRK